MSQEREMAIRYVGNFLDGAMASVVKKHKTKAYRVRGLGNPEEAAEGAAPAVVELTVEEKAALDADIAKIKTAYDTLASAYATASAVNMGVSQASGAGLGLITKPKSVEKYQGFKTFAILTTSLAIGQVVQDQMIKSEVDKFISTIDATVSPDFKAKFQAEDTRRTFKEQMTYLFKNTTVPKFASRLQNRASILDPTMRSPTQKYVYESLGKKIDGTDTEGPVNKIARYGANIASAYHGAKRNAQDGTFSAVMAGIGWFIMSRAGVGLALAQGYAKPYPTAGSSRSNPTQLRLSAPRHRSNPSSRLPTKAESTAISYALATDNFMRLELSDIADPALRKSLSGDLGNHIVDNDGLLIFYSYGLCAIRANQVNALIAAKEAEDDKEIARIQRSNPSSKSRRR